MQLMESLGKIVQAIDVSRPSQPGFNSDDEDDYDDPVKENMSIIVSSPLTKRVEAIHDNERSRSRVCLGGIQHIAASTNSVEQYLERFEELTSQVIIYLSDLPKSYYVTCFINGLRPDIKGPVLSLRPTRLHQAIALIVQSIGRYPIISADTQGIYSHDMQILIDGGSIHCFLDEDTASKLGCELEQTTPMVVSVADSRQMAMTSALVLAVPDFTKSFVIGANACHKGVGPLTVDPYIPTTQPEVGEYLRERLDLVELLKINLIKAQNRMKIYADKHRTTRGFLAGDYVYLKLQLYRHNFLQLRRTLKLASKYYGTFQVIEMIGEVAYKLKLPPSLDIHPIFMSHSSKRKSDTSTHYHLIPVFTDHGICRAYPAKIPFRRLIFHSNTVVPHILVQWENYSEAEATWEDYYGIISKFPEFVINPQPQGRGQTYQGAMSRS
ncbi:hypothetical protein Sango_0246100 [Sesamum angolense]|uniref:Tf2-1-like SH3-like domain-containing protein n=1 Tax=Sesamum angolense TaxID=2727404 RepID=A0AAE1XH01_9LAMI|nr:hypothetical protein Sango_0246100 [Sesamum angolense]